MMGYAETRADLNRGDDLGGVLATGDLGRLDEAGRLWITGRLKRIAKPFGLRVNLDDVETALCSLGRLAAVSDDKVIAICVETGDIAAITQAAEALATQFGLPVSLLRVRAIEALPRSPDGKIRYGEIAP